MKGALGEVWFRKYSGLSSEQGPCINRVANVSSISRMRDIPADDLIYENDLLLEADYFSSLSLSPIPNDVSVKIVAPSSSEAAPAKQQSETVFYRHVCVAVTKDCIEKFELLLKPYEPLLGNIKRRDIMYKTLEERYEFSKGPNYDNYVINAKYTDIHKLIKDAKTLSFVMSEACEEMKVFGSVLSMVDYEEPALQMLEDEEDFLEKVRKKQEVYNNLNRKYRNFRSDHNKMVKDLDAKTRELFVELKDYMECARTEISFTKSWENSRKEQNCMFLKGRENFYKSTVSHSLKQMDLEDNAHDNFMEYLEETKADYADDIQRWMDKYDREFEEKELDIDNMRHRTDVVIENREKLQIEYERRIQAMKDWRECKRLKIIAQEQLALEICAATIIQAWWRAIMIRKKLGPYSKKKKKDQGKNKKKAKRRK